MFTLEAWDANESLTQQRSGTTSIPAEVLQLITQWKKTGIIKDETCNDQSEYLLHFFGGRKDNKLVCRDMISLQHIFILLLPWDWTNYRCVYESWNIQPVCLLKTNSDPYLPLGSLCIILYAYYTKAGLGHQMLYKVNIQAGHYAHT